MSLQIKYVDAPVGAQTEAVFSADSTQPFGTTENLQLGSTDTPWATLEPGCWALDGSRVLFPNDPKQIGWWSTQRSEDDGRFAQPPVISISFPQPYTATGITFWFWPSLGHWCSEIQVSWYNGETLLAETTQYPDEAEWVLSKAVEAFDRIDIQLLATNVPGQFAKIRQIQIGHVVLFLQDEIVKVSLLNEVDPSLCQLSVDTMTVEIRDRKNRPLIPQMNQSMQLFRNGQQIASHYITDSNRQTQQYYTFRCQSAIGQLEDDYLGGVYSGETVKNLLDGILDGFSYKLDEQFAEDTLTGYLPVCTRREALQQIAFAIGAVVTTQGDGTIRLSPLPEETEAAFTDGDIFTGAKVSREAQTATVQIFAHSYTRSNEEETLLNGEQVSGESVLFFFSEPHYDYYSPDDSCVITDSGANWVQITGGEGVTLTAKKYKHSTSVYAKKNPLATAAEKGNVVTVENATLIHAGNVEMALSRLYDFYMQKNVLTQQVIVTGQKAGQIARSTNPWGSITEGYITSMESAYTHTGHTADITIRGKEVQSE